MVARCKDELGGLDVLVNNAGTTRFIDHTNLEALTDEVWDEIFNVNLKGTFYCCRAALPLLQERRGSDRQRHVGGRACRATAAPFPTRRARRPSTA